MGLTKMDDQQPDSIQSRGQGPWNHPAASTQYMTENLNNRVDRLERRLSQLEAQNRTSQLPNLGIRIFLYSAGTLLVFMAIILLFQAFGVLTNIPRLAISALALLALGIGILTGMRSR
jgi:hypothetical protein